MEFASQPAHLLTGSCAGCGHSFSLVEGILPIGTGSPSRRSEESEGAGASHGPDSRAGPPCSLCGAALEITASAGGLSAVCSGCSSSFQFVLQSEVEPPSRRMPSRPSYRRDDQGPPEGPRARPCRNCGGPLQFSTSAEGLVTGTCASCGNRFTLPPRGENGGRDRWGRPGSRGGYSPRRNAGSWRRGDDRGAPPPRFRSRGPPFRRRDRRGESDEDDSPRGSRRRRDAE